MNIMNKTKYLLLALLCFAVSCETEVQDNTNDNANDNANETGFALTMQEAQQNLESFMKQLYVPSKGEHSGKTIVNGFLLHSMTKAENESCPPVYVFNFAEDGGYAFVGGDSRLPTLLCLMDEGNMSEGEIVDEAGPNILLANIDTYCRMRLGLPVTDADGVVHSPDEYGYKPSPDVKSPNHPIPIIIGQHGSIVNCHWHQSSPFNLECFTPEGNQALVGCLPIAVGQIMYYWGKNCTYGGRYYDWQQMHNVIDSSSCPTDTAAWSGVQHLLAALGEPANLNASYGMNATGANMYNAPSTFENFGYYSGGAIESYDARDIASYVENGPVLMAGWSHRRIWIDDDGNEIMFLGYSHGHAWMLDYVLEVNEYVNGGSIPSLEIYCHCNWGWGGNRDGYFLTGVFDSNNPTLIRDVMFGTLSNIPQETKSSITEVGTSYYYQYNLLMDAGIEANHFLM